MAGPLGALGRLEHLRLYEAVSLGYVFQSSRLCNDMHGVGVQRRRMHSVYLRNLLHLSRRQFWSDSSEICTSTTLVLRLLPSSASFTRPEGPSVVRLVEKSQGEQATQRRLGFGAFSG